MISRLPTPTTRLEECAVAKNTSLSALESALTISSPLKSPGMNSCKKMPGVPPGCPLGPLAEHNFHFAIAIAGLRVPVLASGFSQAARGASVSVEPGFTCPERSRGGPARRELQKSAALKGAATWQRDILSRGRQ